MKVVIIIVSGYCDVYDHSAGFRTLLLEDQMAVLKSSFMELSILRLAFRCVDSAGVLSVQWQVHITTLSRKK